MNRTENYSLPAWEKSDPIRMDDFNDLTGKLDAVLKAGADAVAACADAETVAALAQKWERGRVCRVAWGSYTGTGTYGKDHPNTLSCDFTPVMFIVGGQPHILGQTSFAYSNHTNVLTWGARGVSWYVKEYTTVSDQGQLNSSGAVYSYLILGYAEDDDTEE